MTTSKTKANTEFIDYFCSESFFINEDMPNIKFKFNTPKPHPLIPKVQQSY